MLCYHWKMYRLALMPVVPWRLAALSESVFIEWLTDGRWPLWVGKVSYVSQSCETTCLRHDEFTDEFVTNWWALGKKNLRKFFSWQRYGKSRQWHFFSWHRFSAPTDQKYCERLLRVSVWAPATVVYRWLQIYAHEPALRQNVIDIYREVVAHAVQWKCHKENRLVPKFHSELYNNNLREVQRT